MAAEGKCIAHHEGQAIFVRGVAPGDVVDLRIVKARKKYMEAVPLHFHQLSDQRVEPFCSHFGICGGCKWQHIPYGQQLAYKQEQVNEQFARIGKAEAAEVLPILGSENTTYYRNKLEFTFSVNRWLTRQEIDSGEELDHNALGFHIPQRFEKILPISHCYLQPDPSNDIRLALDRFARAKEISFYDHVKHTGILRNLIIRNSNTGEFMVIVQFGGDAADAPDTVREVMEFLKSDFPQLTSLFYIINAKKNDTYYDLPVQHYAGESFLLQKMESLSFRISPKAFYQTNHEQAYELYKVARKFAALNGREVVYDLYTGTGTIANFVARQARQVIGIEYVEEAIEDAKVNARINQINNASFYAGDLKEVLDESFVGQHQKPDVVITDPPRNGMHPDVVKTLLRLSPGRIVYVSCNPATQARDVSMLSEQYELLRMQAVDMFPHTHHIENVALLQLRKG